MKTWMNLREMAFASGLDRWVVAEAAARGLIATKKLDNGRYCFHSSNIWVLNKIKVELEHGRLNIPRHSYRPRVAPGSPTAFSAADDLIFQLSKNRKRGAAFFARQTPGFVSAMFGFMGCPPLTGAMKAGLTRETFYQWGQGFHPERLKGRQAMIMTGFYWMMQTLYTVGKMPFSLAQCGGVYDPEAAKLEAQHVKALHAYR